jgi:hypothetical protein
MYDTGGAVGWFFLRTVGSPVVNSNFGAGARILGGKLIYRCSID